MMWFLLAASVAQAGELHGIIKNNEGVQRYDKGRGTDAYGYFMNALGDLPFSPEIQYNVGNSMMVANDPDKAMSQWKLAIKLAPGSSAREKEVRFRSLFNIGTLLAARGKTDEALESYQSALEIKPDSIETKTNMELLTQTGGGGGKGDKDQKDQKDDKGEGTEHNNNPQFSQTPKKNEPQPYKGKDLSKQDVDRILDELKQQEESIRAKDQHEGGKDAPPDKDW